MFSTTVLLPHLMLPLCVVLSIHMAVPQACCSLCILEESLELSLLGAQHKVQGPLWGEGHKGSQKVTHTLM